ncbi:hypothetical protein GQ55_8G006300 [Panicum hallii var. hallii]|uniref:Serine incorporator n=1 Tax=Panicum hallii var. hallii TaxID=1504633 RepID=A0A2T7CJA6_9POAL|nr:hypothetical protein GQ55_8G006300 [Panicum hallii var. hallii]
MFLSTVCTRKVHDRRNSWHCQWWLAKIVLLVGSIMISTVAPSELIQLYGKVVAPFGAGVFLSTQLLSVIRYITRWNNKWCIRDSENRYLEVIAVSVIMYSGSMVGIILMSLWYTSCWLNIAFIGTTALLVCLMPLIALKTKANGFYMEPGLVGAYSVFLCYSAIKSEPETSCCYKKEKAGAGADWKTIISFVGELMSTAASAFSTGKDYKTIQLRNDIVRLEDDIPYGYGFFHFIFTMGSMYFGMLFLGWDTHHIMEKFSVDVGWMSAWVHIVNEGLAVISFVAILVARIYGIGWLRQLLARIFGIGGQQQQPPPPSEMNILRSSNNDDGTGAAPRSPPPLPQATEEFQEVVSSNDDIAGPPPLPVNIGSRNDDVHAAGSSSSRPAACATAGRRRVPGGNWWTTIMRRLTTRKLMLFFLCVHVTFNLSLAFLYMMYTHRSTQ